MRLFLGLDLPVALKQNIDSYLAPMRISAKGWENLHDYHLTLLFLGETDSARLPEIKQRMHLLKGDQFKLETDEFRFFNRRIMYLGFKKSEPLLKLRALVREQFPEWAREEKKLFIPHLTVKRWQRYEHATLLAGLKDRPFPAHILEIKKISLFVSHKNEFNQKYHILHETLL